MSEVQIEGEIIGFTYMAEEGAFGVARLKTNSEELTVVGPIAHAQPGQQVQIKGEWSEHPVFGKQVSVKKVLVKDPKSLEGIERFLSKGGIKGLGPTYAKRIVAHFGYQTLNVLDREPEKLKKVPGIGKKRAESINKQWQKEIRHREIRASLHGEGLGTALTQRLLDRYGEEAMAILRRDPYRLCNEIRGIGFHGADQLAMKQGISADSPLRARAGILHILKEAESQGHCHLPLGSIFLEADKLNIPLKRVEEGLQRLKREREILSPQGMEDQIHRSAMWRTENRVANLIIERKTAKDRQQLKLHRELPMDIEKIEKNVGIAMNTEQREALKLAMREGICVITGGPGTGKTTIVKALISAAQSRGETWLLAAPTGRAAKRLSESTGFEAQTIHRMLSYNGHSRSFNRNSASPLEADAILIDEVSMLDIWLMASVLDALADGSRLILVGDDDQLPSVGPGRVLGDLIESGAVPVRRLEMVYRQSRDSNIVQNAHRVNKGQAPLSVEKDPGASEKKDFFVLHRTSPHLAQKTILEIVSERMPRMGFDPFFDVQILSPMHNGPLGTIALNEKIQNVLNPEGRKHQIRQKEFRVGDRVMQIKNDHEAEIYNGDIGRVADVDEKGITIQFDERQLRRTGAQLSSLELAYAVTAHKSQGSEYPAVIIALHDSHHIMLRRNLLYTALTRAKKFCCLVGSEAAIRKAAEQGEARKRHTSLSGLLSNGAQ